MADEPSVVTQQQKATLQSTESHLLKVSSVKRLGYYSKNELTELRALFTELLAALNTNNTGFYELFDNQKITEARIEKTGPTALTTDAGLPGDATSDKRNLLFFADWVALVLDIAHVLQEHYPSQTLEYVALQDTESFLKDWGSEADGKISQISLQYESAQNVVELLSNVSRQFDYLAQTESEQEEDDEDTEDSENTDESKPTDATDEDDDWSSSANRVQTQNTESGEAEAPTPYAEDVEIDREDTSVRKDIATEVTWVFNAARVNLLQQFLDEAGIDPNNLPPALRARLTSLEDALRDELYRITDSLSDADLRQLLNHRFRLSLYRQLLTNILANPANPFYTELLQFYKEFTKTTVQTAEPDVQADVIRQFEVAFAGVDSTDAENKALQAIHQEVQAWIAQLRREFAISQDTEPDEIDQTPDADPKQQKTDETTDTDQILTQTDVALVPSVPPAKNAFSATQTEQLTNSFETVVSLPAAERRALQNQSARLVWGAAAEIFGDTSNLPPQLIDTISGHAVSYLLSSLSPEELAQLAKSPSTLLRHIRGLANEVRNDVRFQMQLEQLGTLKQNPEVSRTDLIEREIEVGYQTVVQKIFYEKGITEYTLAQEPQLVAEFKSITEFIRQELYVELSELSIEELQALVSDMASQEQFLARFERELIGGNPQLSRVLRAFLRRYIAHMTATGQLREADAAQRILLDVSSGFELAETPEARRERVRTERTEEAGTAEITSRQVLQTTGPQTEEPETTSEGQALIQTSSEAVRKKKSLLNNLLENEWKQLSHEEKVAVYLHYDYPVPKKFRKSNPDLQQSNQYFVLVPEFLELDRQNLLPILVHNLTHPPDGKAELALDAPLTADRINKLHTEKEISDRALNTQLETAATQIADPETHRRLVQYAQLQEEQRQTVLRQILEAHREELAVLAQAYNIEVAQIRQLVQQEAFIQELQAQQAIAALQALEQAAALDADPELGSNFTSWRDDFAQAMNLSSRKGSAREALQKKLMSRFTPSKEQLMKKGLQSLATRAGLTAATGGTAAVVIGGLSLLQDPRTRDMLVGGLGYMTALALQAFSNLAGLVTFLGVTGAVAFIPGLGFLAIPAGLAAGGLAASLFPNAPSLLGIRMPPAPWSELSQSGPGLRELRGAEAAQAEAAEAAQASNAAEASRASSAANAQAARAQAAAEAASEGGSGNGNGAGQTPAELSVQGSATAAATSSTTSSFFGLPIWGFTTISAFTLVFLLSWSVILVIMGAFIAPVPTRIADYAGTDPINAPTQSQYVTILKTASPAKIENLTSGETATIEYTITIQPKADYTLDLRSVKDTVSGFGDVVPDLSVYNGALTTEDLPTDRVVDPVTITYSIEYSGTITDALVNNSALFSMTVYDAYDYPVKQNETVTAVGSVRVGNPTIGCWPTDGDIWQLPGGDFSHDSPYLDAYDIANKIGTPVYAPFPGEYCDRGLDTAASGGYGRHGSLQISLNSGGEERILTFYFGHFINGAPIPGLDSRKCKQVAAGELIGLMDDTGYSKGSHLHFELRPNPYGIKLVDLMQGGQQVNAAFNAGKYPPVQHCFNRN